MALDSPRSGNVRELEQLAARLTIEAPAAPVSQADLTRLLGAKAGDAAPPLDVGLGELMARSEREWLVRALREFGSLTRREIAERLNISEAALYKKLKQHGLTGSE